MLRWRSKKIFVSYRRTDAPEIAQSLNERLGRQFGASNVFFDRADIEHGQRWRDEVTRQIGAADIVLALIGPRWMETLRERAKGDDVLRFELAAALEKKKQVIPILVGSAPMPHAAELPEEVRGLTDFQALAISHDIELAMLELLGRVKPGLGLAMAWSFGTLGGWSVALLGLVFTLMAFGITNGDRAPIRLLLGSAIAGALLGACIGVPQWLVLRPWFERARFLVPAYVLLSMLAVGIAITRATGDGTSGPGAAVLMMLLLPLGLGITLWWIVSKQLVYAGWWSTANVAAPFVGLIIAALNQSAAGKAQQSADPAALSASLSPLMDLLLPILVMSLLSGALLVWLMRISEIKRR